MSHRRIHLALLLFFLAFLAHAPALVGVMPGALPSTGDTLGAFAPWHEFTRRELARNGAIPLWNPHLYVGVPFVANGQSALFYAPTYLHFLLPENLALWLFALLHTYFLLLGGYFLGRTLGVSRPAALLIAVLLGWGNATPAHLFGGHLTFLAARAFWPWQAAFLIRLLRGDAAKIDVKNAVGLAACLALGLAAGAPQIWIFGVLIGAAITLFWGLGAAPQGVLPARWPWKSAVLTMALLILWCASVLLPLRELEPWSSHGGTLSFDQVSDLSATPRSLFRLLFNNFFGGNSYAMWSLPSNPGEDSASIGLAPCLLALGAPFFAPKSRLVRALWLGCALVLLIALGSATPFYRWLYDHISLFQITRVPARWLELWAFGAAILAGIGFDALRQNPLGARRVLLLWIGAALTSLALAAAVFWSQSLWQGGAQIVAHALRLPAERAVQIAPDLQNEALLSCFLAAFALGALALVWRRGLGSKPQIALILAVLCAEPLANFWLSVRITPALAVQNAQLPAAISRKYRPGERWIVRAPFQQLNAPFGAAIDSLNGYEPLGSAPFFAFAGAAQPGTRFSADFQPQKMTPLWRVMGASHVVWKPKTGGDTPRGFPGQTIARDGEWRLNSIEDGLKPWPRTYLTRHIERGDGPKSLQILQKLAAQPFGIAPPAIVEKRFPDLQNAPLSPRETSRQIFASPDLRRFQIAPAHDSLWVQNEALAPGWRAFVDGKPAKIHLANAMFRGVLVPRGAREITVVYDSQTLRFALFLSLFGLGLAVFCRSFRR